MAMPVVDCTHKPLGYQQITSLSAATGLTVPSGANRASITAEAQTVRWRDDGTNPTASVGMPITAGNGKWYIGDLTKIKFIQATSGGILNVAYYSENSQ